MPSGRRTWRILMVRPPLTARPGKVSCTFSFCQAVERFFLEFLRGDYVNLTLGLKSAQMTSVIAFVIALVIFIVLQFKGNVDEKISG